MNIIELNKIKQFEVQLIIDLGKSYGKYINDIVMSLNKDEMISYDGAINDLVTLRENSATTIQNITMPIETLLLKSYELYQIYSEISAKIATILHVASNPNYSRMAMYNYSGTTLNAIVINRNQLIETIERYSEINIDTDIKIIKELISRANVADNVRQILLFLMKSEHSTNRYVIELVRTSVKYIGGTDRVKLLNIIEHEKDKVLGSSRQKLEYPGVQGMIVRCGLVPVTESLLFTDLLKLIDGAMIHDTISADKRGDHTEALDIVGGSRKTPNKSAIKTAKTQSKYIKTKSKHDVKNNRPIQAESVQAESTQAESVRDESIFNAAQCVGECFEHLASVNNICVVLIDKCSSNPIEFNINGLISTEYVEKYNLRTRPGTCVDDKVLKRYNTVSEMQPIRTAPSKLQIFGRATVALVIETINGDRYRILCNSMNHYFTPTSIIVPYIDGLNSRLTKYHLLHETDILSKCFDAKARDILANYQKSTIQFPIETAQRDLSEKLSEAFIEHVTTVMPKNLQEFKELIDKDKISSIMMGVFLKFLPVSQNPEYAITYIVRFEDIIRLFNKEIDSNMRNVKITDLTFRERSPNDLQKFLIDTFGDIVRRSIEEMRKTKKFNDIETSLKEFYMEQKNI